ncbi:right-handed parallel beta-helix repeat-containing protein [Natronoflexus pectinivorans]|uniref:Putative secreted protein (Por secretion system target) n=1 Tax=Natronoflexus pectinivorans TaxID=682526 RepID=A0A4R2GI43_9BACT|nr:right-handed parallel beta-helix repeat-containing protein [Natronoflexus pectinivorans]TCO08219.1 putative secreted protein (Por secretion system target) [Natronoflexus pectinivorans]
MKKYFTFVMFLMAIMLSESALSQRTAEVIREEGEPWVAKVNGNQVYSGLDMILAIQTAINNLTQNRTEKEVVNVRTSGSTGRHSWNGDVKAINLPSNTIIDFHDNTMNVNDDAQDNIIVPIRAIRANNIEVRNMRITGNPRYGIWIFGSENVTLENIHISIPQAYNIGLGIRIQERDATWSRNVTMDNIYVEHSKHHGVEIWNTDGLSIGTVTTKNTGGCGLLLNSTRNATVQLVDAYRANHGGGYAGLRFANNCGPNVVVEKVIANSCGRGVFSVSGSHGITINEVDIYGSTNQGILIEDTKDFTINGGVVKNSSSQGVRITSRSSTEHHASSNVLVQNLRVYDDRTPMVQSYGIQETTPRTNNNKILNNDLRNGGRTADLSFSGPGTIAEGNILTGMEPPTTKISDLLSDQTIAIYPNPSNGSFTIHSSHLATHVEFKIEIFDLQGRLAFSDKKTFTGTIDLNTELNSGVYLIRISNNNDIFSSRLIISR